MEFKKVIRVLIPHNDKQVSALMNTVSPNFTITKAIETIGINQELSISFNAHLEITTEIENSIKTLLLFNCNIDKGNEIEGRNGHFKYQVDKIKHTHYLLYKTIVTTYYLHEVV